MKTSRRTFFQRSMLGAFGITIAPSLAHAKNRNLNFEPETVKFELGVASY